jgi:hypothetical protein
VLSPVLFFRKTGGAPGGDGVDTGADEDAVVPDETDGIRGGTRPGVENPEAKEPKERSCECDDASCRFSACDIRLPNLFPVSSALRCRV